MLGGYDLIKILHNKFRVFLSPGTIYPALSSLEEGNIIRSAQGRRKKVYKLTDKGIKMVEVLLNNYSKAQKQNLLMLGLSPSVQSRSLASQRLEGLTEESEVLMPRLTKLRSNNNYG